VPDDPASAGSIEVRVLRYELDLVADTPHDAILRHDTDVVDEQIRIILQDLHHLAVSTSSGNRVALTTTSGGFAS